MLTEDVLGRPLFTGRGEVVFRTPFEYWIAPTDGSGPARALVPNPVGSPPGRLDPGLTPDGLHLLLWSGDDRIDAVTLRGLPASRPVVQGSSVGFLYRFRITPDGRRIVWLEDREIQDVPELYSSPLGPRRAKLPRSLGGPGRR